jgi:hypothetical protein
LADGGPRIITNYSPKLGLLGWVVCCGVGHSLGIYIQPFFLLMHRNTRLLCFHKKCIHCESYFFCTC